MADMYLFPYNEAWPGDYQAQAQQIAASCDEAVRLHHIGSTAVAGLYAKDCIDILGVVDKLERVQHFIRPIAALGFEYRAAYGIEGREYFVKRSPKVHLHIYQDGNCNIARQLGFVRLMQARPDLVAKLNQLKLQLAAKYPTDKAQYQLEKAAFYQEIIQLLESA
ncbi:GrpB family protein [Rheinheimera fenheensis]|uniref:GrpB family protein n=1 Tax=Rheinheimera fenheensis TaxID=3152295 RepID=UPI00325F49B4